ncbi:MAG: diguanylate cyclase [Chloroflexota bacterium]|nr:diguanylate cyclase [Chloroflexota bacterium]
MSTQPILLVIGIAIAVNLVIMGGLVVTLLVRRRGRYATPNGFDEPAPFRYSAMGTNPPTATSPISFMGEEEYDDETEEYDGDNEDFDEDVSASEPADYRRFRPDMTDEGERAEATIESFLTGGSTNAVPPPRDDAAEDASARTAQSAGAAVGQAPTAPLSQQVSLPAEPVELAPEPTATATPPQPPPYARDQAVAPAANDAVGRLEWEHRIREEEARLARYRRPVTVVLVELEGMDRLIGRFGQAAAERIALPVGKTLARQARASDQVARISSSRFAILLPETDEVQAINYVERIRTECDRWLAAGAVSMRLAIGWASPAPGGDLHTAILIAEERLNADRRRAIPQPDVDEESLAWAATRPVSGQASLELTPPDGAE